jgi:hypothetical protein
LMVGNQIDILIPNFSFGHNLCFKYSSNSYEPILNIYVSRAFQWYKYFFNPMNFNPWNCSLKIWDPIKIPTPKVGVNLRVCGAFTFFCSLGSVNMTPMLQFQPAPFHVFALVLNPRLGSWQLN